MENARDIAIILIAVFAIIQAIAIAALAIITALLIRMLHKKIVPLLERIPGVVDTASSTLMSVERSAKQVQTTTVFASQKTVRPLIRATSFVLGVQATLRALLNMITGRRD